MDGEEELRCDLRMAASPPHPGDWSGGSPYRLRRNGFTMKITAKKTFIALLVAVLFLFRNLSFESYGTKLTDRDSKRFFAAHIEDLKKVAGICQHHRSIRWVGDNGEYYEYEPHPRRTGFFKALDEIQETIDDLDLHSVDCERDGRHKNRALYSVDFAIYASGLFLGGESQSIVFFAEWADSAPKQTEFVSGLIKEGRLKPLSQKGWYIHRESEIVHWNPFRGESLPSLPTEVIAIRADLAATLSKLFADIGGTGSPKAVRPAFVVPSYENSSRPEIPLRYQKILEVEEIDIAKNINETKGMSLSDWKRALGSQGAWDYRNRRRLMKHFDLQLLDEFCHYHFGIVAAARGFGLEKTLWSTGRYQAVVQGGGSRAQLTRATKLLFEARGGRTHPDTEARKATLDGFAWGDELEDSIHVMNGWDYYDGNY